MTYTFGSTGNDGGGRGNACAIDQANSQNCAVAGDVWGTRNSTNGGDKWVAKMQGQSALVYGRAVAFSAKHAGRSYWGVGTLKNNLGGGKFCMQDPANVQLVNLSSTWGFGSNLTSSTNPAGFFPRACGNRIVIDYDAPATTEYVYGQSGTGIFRAVDTTGSLANYTGFPGTAPIQGGGLSMVLAPDGSLYAIDWGARTSETSAPSQTLWHITNPRGTPTVNTPAGPTGGGPMNRLKVINGIVWLLCANGLFKLVGSSWVGVASGFFGTSGHTFSDFCGVGQTMYVATGSHPAGTAHAAAKSTDGGLTWSWVTSAANLDQTVQGTNRQFWLTAFDIQRGLTGDPYGTNSMDCGPTANFVLLAGARGAWTTKDGGATWHPSMNGLMGTEVSHVGLSSTNGEAWNDDTDWGTVHTLNHYQSVTDISNSTTAHSYRAASLTSADGAVVLSFNGSFWDIKKNGVSVADAYSKGAIVNPTDVEHTTDDWIYISQFGGGVTAGNPGGVAATVAPTMGSPTLSTSSPVVGQPLTAFPNPTTWDGTAPLTYTYQWQRQVGSPFGFSRINHGGYCTNVVGGAAVEGARYQVMTLNGTANDEVFIPTLKSNNAFLKVYRYTDPIGADSAHLLSLGDTISYTYADTNHPEWFVLDQFGARMILDGTSTNHVLDVGSTTYQNYAASQMIAVAQAEGGWDGIYLDEINAHINYFTGGGQVMTTPDYSTNAKWQAAITSFLTNVAAQLHAAGYLVVANLGLQNGDEAICATWARLMDGVYFEGYGHDAANNPRTYEGDGDWLTFQTMVADLQAHGQLAWCRTYHSTEAGHTYGLGSLLLVANNYATWEAEYTTVDGNSVYGCSGIGGPVWLPEYDTAKALGGPLGDFTIVTSGVTLYRRDFQNGVVIVNPHTSGASAYSLGVPYSGSGLSHVSSVTLAANTAVIMTKD